MGHPVETPSCLPNESRRCAFVSFYAVSKNVPPSSCYNFDTREWILIFFGRNVNDKVSSEKMLYYAS